MINTLMRTYNYFTLGEENEYGQRVLSPEAQGTVKMAVYTTSQSIQDNINYKDSSYTGITLNKAINDTYVIKYGESKLKVLFVTPVGKYNQVYMSEI